MEETNKKQTGLQGANDIWEWTKRYFPKFSWVILFIIELGYDITVQTIGGALCWEKNNALVFA